MQHIKRHFHLRSRFVSACHIECRAAIGAINSRQAMLKVHLDIVPSCHLDQFSGEQGHCEHTRGMGQKMQLAVIANALLVQVVS